ncbi:MAG: 30S ribosomal protein S17 [Candidatus Cloacimonetes bacterium]|nr:30S ribosomal protein S17 [Candidatus Cloacimonadota bacterium]MBL7107864.1 30S ribosomal protein S17 [Candidatus Cloacimonadota bacterium]
MKNTENRKKHKPTRIGVVVSDKMDKTIVAKVERMFKHPLYGKYIRKHKKYKVHDEKNEAKIGDKVKIEEFRPVSKTKRWRLVEITEKRK